MYGDQDIVQAGELLGIECLDHLVIGKSGYVSLRQKGLWPISVTPVIALGLSACPLNRAFIDE